MGRSGKSLSYLMVESIYYVSFKPYSVTHLSDVKARNPQLIRRFSDALDHWLRPVTQNMRMTASILRHSAGREQYFCYTAAEITVKNTFCTVTTAKILGWPHTTDEKFL